MRCRDISFFILFGITHQVDPRKWDISATQVIQDLKTGASCFSRESSLMMTIRASIESISFSVQLLPAVGRERSAKYAGTGQMEYQDSQIDSMDSKIYILRLLS